MSKFKCQNCGSDQLGYKKYVKCIMPALFHPNGNMEYGMYIVHEDDCLCIDNYYICLSCGECVEDKGIPIETENELIAYFSQDTEHLQQEQEVK